MHVEPVTESEEPGRSRHFQTEGRGIVDGGQGGYYLPRNADDELLEHLLRGEYCHVLAPRQIGKSSLRVHTMQRLRAEGVLCASIDLTGIGTDASPSEWYFSLAAMITDDLDLPGDADEMWRKHKRMSPVKRFRQFLRDDVLGETGPPVAIFIDEIDVTLKLPFSRDDFFGLIREMHQARAADEVWNRLRFCLIGVATPLDLVRDAERTPFNTSVGVELSDFSFEEARGLLPGLASAGGSPEELLHAVLHWTDGHPALTQRLCYWLAERSDEGDTERNEDDRVAALVRSLFLKSGRIDDPILHDIEKRFADDRPDARVSVMLHLYSRLLSGEDVPSDGNNPRQFGLRIAGIAAERHTSRGSFLRVRNRIVEHVFGRAWLDDKLARRMLTEPLEIWREGGRRDAHVLRGEALELALKWAKGNEDVTPDEHDYLTASQRVALKEQDARKQAEIDRVQRARAVTQRRASTAVAVVALLLVGLLLFMYRKAVQATQVQEALAQDERAKKEAALAQQELAKAQATRLLELAMKDADTARLKETEAEAAMEKLSAEIVAAKKALDEAKKRAASSWALAKARQTAQVNYELKVGELQVAQTKLAAAERAASEAKRREAEARAAAEAPPSAPEGVPSIEELIKKASEDAAKTERELQRRLDEAEAKVAAITGQRDEAQEALRKREVEHKAAQERIANLRNEIANLKGQVPR